MMANSELHPRPVASARGHDGRPPHLGGRPPHERLGHG
jgi:hypothetical protein